MVLGVIPARYGSTRFPGKALAKINGTPMVQLVWERASQAKRLNRLIVATDDQRIQKTVQEFGGEAFMTSTGLLSGTDRVWAVAQGIPAPIIVNIQGDEPLILPTMVDQLVGVMEHEPTAQMATLRFQMKSRKDFIHPNVVKVVTDSAGWALYFSRSPVPFFRGAERSLGQGTPVWYKHIGLYAYRRAFLERLVHWPPSLLEKAEGLEQLRALEHGEKIKVLDSPYDTIGVDAPDDVKRVEKFLNA